MVSQHMITSRPAQHSHKSLAQCAMWCDTEAASRHRQKLNEQPRAYRSANAAYFRPSRYLQLCLVHRPPKGDPKRGIRPTNHLNKSPFRISLWGTVTCTISKLPVRGPIPQDRFWRLTVQWQWLSNN